MAVHFHTPPENQGQIVEVSFGWADGALLRRSFDASDRTVVTRRIADPWDGLTATQAQALESWGPWNSEPPHVDFDADGEVVYHGHVRDEPVYDDEA